VPGFNDFDEQVKAVLQDGASKLADADRQRFIRQAIAERYSQDRPQELVSELTGDGTNDLALPAGFERDFSNVRQLEYPIGEIPPALVEQEDLQIYRTPAADKLRVLSTAIGNTEKAYLTWTARHNSDGSTVAARDFYAVCDLAAAAAFEALAAIYAQTGDSSVGADAVNYRSKSQEYLALAKTLRQRYYTHMGIDPNASSPGVGPALSLGEMDQDIGGTGVDRLTHGKNTR
jgi:hypothetical protein